MLTICVPQLEFTINFQFTVTISISENHELSYPKEHLVHFFLRQKLKQGCSTCLWTESEEKNKNKNTCDWNMALTILF